MLYSSIGNIHRLRICNLRPYIAVNSEPTIQLKNTFGLRMSSICLTQSVRLGGSGSRNLTLHCHDFLTARYFFQNYQPDLKPTRQTHHHIHMSNSQILVTEISALIMTLSPGLEKNYTLQQSSNSFSGTTSMSGCLENCQ